MAVSNEDIKDLIECLPEDAKQSAYDYLKYLMIQHDRSDWSQIDSMESDNTPLSQEELKQFNRDDD